MNSPTDAKERISVVATIRAKSGCENEVRTAFQAVAGPAQQEAGCISYQLLKDKYYTGSFFTVEEWESEEYLDAHGADQGGIKPIQIATSGRRTHLHFEAACLVGAAKRHSSFAPTAFSQLTRGKESGLVD